MNKKSGTMIAAIGVILFVVYNLLAFLIFSGDKNGVFWVSYLFAVLSFLVCAFCFYYSLKDVTINTVFFGIPLMSFSLYFLILETIVSFVMMAVRKSVPMTVAVLIQLLILAAFLIVAIISILSKNYSSGVNTKITQDVRYVQSFRVSVEGYAERCPDPIARKSLEALAETARYADQRSNANVVSVEQRIQQLISNIDQALARGDYQAVIGFSNQANMAFAERDRLLRLG